MRRPDHKQQKLPAIVSLALLLFVPMPLFAQFLCDDDGVKVVFMDEVAGALQLREVSARELSDSGSADQAFDLGPGVGLKSRLKGRTISTSTPGFSGHHVSAVSDLGIERLLPNAWEASFPKGLYEFREKADIELEIRMTVADRQASLYGAEDYSAVTLEVEESRVHESWYSGTNSLRSVRGSLDLRISDLQKLGAAGIHRATLTVCVNVRGNL